MGGMQGDMGMELWAIVPELTLAGLVLILLPLGPFLPKNRKYSATWIALAGLVAVAIESVRMLFFATQPIFLDTYAVDQFAVYLFMNLGAFLAVDALERQLSSDDIDQVAGLGRRLPVTAAVLAICLPSLAGFPPFGGFVGKTMLFGAAIAAGWTWLAIIMLVNIAVSLYYYVRVLAPMYFQPSPGASLKRELTTLRFVLIVLGIGTLISGVFPQEWVLLATHASSLLAAIIPR